MSASDTLIEALRRHALVIGEVTLTSGATAQYYVDAKRAILRPEGFGALAELVAGYARQWEATAVGGLTGVYSCLYVNKDLMQKAGVTDWSSSYDALREAAKATT